MKKQDFSKLMDNNLFLRVISVVIAIAVWASITIVTNPNQERTIYGVAVEIPVSETAVGKLGLQVVEGNLQTAEIRVSGKRYRVGNLDANNISVRADVSNIKQPGRYNLKLTARQRQEDDEYSIESVSPSSISVRFDYVVSAEFPLEVEAPNITAQDNLVKGDAYGSVETVKLEGPQSDIERIKRVVLTTDRKEVINDTLITNGALQLYDDENQKISSAAIRVEPEDLQMTIPVYKQKNLTLTFDYRNVPDGFPIDELKYTMSKSSLRVMASGEAVDNVKELNLGYIDMRTIDINSSYTLSVGLPSGFVNLEDVEKVTVKFQNTDLIAKTFNVRNISIVNQPEDYDLSLETSLLKNVRIVGKREIVNALTAQDIVASVDLLNDVQITEPGQVNAPVRVSVPGKGLVWAVGEYSVVVHAAAKP